ncbi:MAG TPA: hypothetical protein VN132_13685 [Bdellovibrio sp.]|nr:hypothetical protein [Bdellovibrio sp.]
MKKTVSTFVLLLAILSALPGNAAVVNFYSNPHVPQPLFHVSLEYKGYQYEADPVKGGIRTLVSQVAERPDIRIAISDDLVDEAALQSQLGLAFDFNFIWNNNKTYCAKLVGIALHIPPQPMNFAGTHYVLYHPDWINRHDPGLSPDQIYEFAQKHEMP